MDILFLVKVSTMPYLNVVIYFLKMLSTAKTYELLLRLAGMHESLLKRSSVNGVSVSFVSGPYKPTPPTFLLQ